MGTALKHHQQQQHPQHIRRSGRRKIHARDSLQAVETAEEVAAAAAAADSADDDEVVEVAVKMMMVMRTH